MSGGIEQLPSTARFPHPENLNIGAQDGGAWAGCERCRCSAQVGYDGVTRTADEAKRLAVRDFAREFPDCTSVPIRDFRILVERE